MGDVRTTCSFLEVHWQREWGYGLRAQASGTWRSYISCSTNRNATASKADTRGWRQHGRGCVAGGWGNTALHCQRGRGHRRVTSGGWHWWAGLLNSLCMVSITFSVTKCTRVLLVPQWGQRLLLIISQTLSTGCSAAEVAVPCITLARVTHVRVTRFLHLCSELLYLYMSNKDTTLSVQTCA